MIKFRNTLFVLVLVLLCCKKPYNPPASSTSDSYLVVEGVINSGNDSTVIVISKTVQLTGKTNNPVSGAVVTVEGEHTGVYNLHEQTGNGHYSSVTGLNLSPSQKYRLRILNGGHQYLSDFVAIKSAPPIDSLWHNVKNGNVNIFVSAHDPTNNTRYYRWDYDETWQFHSKYQSYWMADTILNAIVMRTQANQIYNCFGNDASQNILLNSTKNLVKDVVFQNAVAAVPLTSEKMETRYSILVKQYALTPEAFEFYLRLQKNTEQLGGIFDAQPSQLTGNIHCVTDPGEFVLGYITAGNVQTKRIFISHTDLPGDVQAIYPYDCREDTATNVQNTLINRPITSIPTRAVSRQRYLYSSIQCVDCTVRGTKQAPSWWH